MKTCPKCNEFIGDTPEICPICKYQFTDADKALFLKEKNEREDEERIQFEIMRAKRAKMRIILVIIALSALFIGFFLGGIIAKATGNIGYFATLATAGMVTEIIVLITGILNGAFRCPYCDTVLFRNYGKYCMHCGKKLYD